MTSGRGRLAQAALVWILLLGMHPAAAELFRVASYNLEGYLDQPSAGRAVKSAEARAKIRHSIIILRPDVLALQEIGSPGALAELRDTLKAEGLDLPHSEHVAGFDTNIHVAILSRFPFSARRPHTNDVFLLDGRSHHVSRGFAEVDVQVDPNYSFTLLVAHLKSRRPLPQADEAELRLEEAKLLREKIDGHFAANPRADLVVLGDFNDTFNSESIKAIIGRGKHKLLDTRPAECPPDGRPNPPSAAGARNITWTYYYEKNDSFSRIDYILISQGMARKWVSNETYVLAIPDWGAASDHRPIIATFEVEGK